MSEEIRTVEFRGQTFYFYDSPTLPMLISEIFNDNYKIFERGIEFQLGDIIVDIGANEGVFSIMMSKLFPFVKVVCCEPVPKTYFQLMRNIGLNGAANVEAHCVGISDKTEVISMVVNNDLSGGSSGVQQHYDPERNRKELVNVTTLDSFLRTRVVGKVKLMKMDIEGMEYDALYASKLLPEVEYFVGEFHINTFLKDVKGRDVKELATYVGSKTNLIYYETCHMAE